MRSLLGIVVCLIAVACSPSTAPDAPTKNDAAAPAPAVDDSPPAPAAAIEPDVLVDLLEQEIPYGEGPAGNLIGFLAVPADAAEPLPGVIVLHEWWGLTPEIRNAARRIARAGYVVLAVDLYAGRSATDVAGAQALMGELVAAPDQVRDNIRQAYEYLELYAFAPRVGAVGWDLGGRWALQAALMYPQDLDSTAIIYGAVETDEAVLAPLQMPLLGLFGENDASVPIDSVREFRTTLLRLEKPAEVRIYSGAEHGFFFPGGDNYAPLMADDAWTRLLGHLASALQ